MLDYERTADYSDGVPVRIDERWPRPVVVDEDAVQVKLTPRGEWHRKLVGIPLGARSVTTGCGETAAGYAVRDSSYTGDLCRGGCFSAFELDQNKLSKVDLNFDDDITLTDDER